MTRLQYKIQRQEIIMRARREHTQPLLTVLPKKTVAARRENENRRDARAIGIEVVA